MCIFKKLTQRIDALCEEVSEVKRLISEYHADESQTRNEIKEELVIVDNKLKNV